MEFDKNNIGKVLLSKNGEFVVVGFDVISDSYLAINLKDFGHKTYWRIFEGINNCEDFEDIIIKLDSIISDLEQVEEILFEKEKELYYAHSELSLEKIYRRLRECYNNALCTKMYSEKNDSMAETYKKEYLNNEKGLRRALKRLYSVYDEDEYYILLDYLIANKYDINREHICSKISRYKRKKVDFVTEYNTLIEELKNSRF